MRTISVKQAYAKRFKTFEMDGVWKQVFYKDPETTGAMIIYGDEKQGKTTFALMFANYLSKFGNVLYISAEEGVSEHFISVMQRMGVDDTNKKLKLHEYEDFELLEQRFAKRQCPKIIFIDNITVYKDEISKAKLQLLLRNNRDKLIIFLSHEERKLPDTAEGRMWSKLSRAIIRIVGQKAFFKGRGVGGELMIDEEKAQLFHGSQKQ